MNRAGVAQRWRVALALAVLLAAAAGVYWPSLAGGFVVDDQMWASGPPPEFGVVLERAFASWGFRDAGLGLDGPPIFRPLATLLTGLAHAAFGADPFPYRLASLLLHCANGALLFVLLARLLPGVGLVERALASGLFLLHPALVEPVAWISSAAELYMSGFVLLALLAFDSARAPGGGAGAWRVLFVLCAACAMLSKEAALALPLLLVLVQWQRRAPLRVFETIAAALLALVYLGWRQWLLQGHGGSAEALSLSPLRVLEFALAHLRFLLLPAAQPFSIAPPNVPLATGPETALALGVLALLALAAWRLAPAARRALGLGMGWTLCALWPAYAIALVGDGFFAGRHAYLPAVGLAIAVAVLLRPMLARWRVETVLAGLAALLYCGLAAWQAGGFWQDNLVAYGRAAKLSPRHAGVWAGIGYAELDAGRLPAARAAFERALEQPNTRRSEQEIRFALAGTLAQLQLFELSDRHLGRLLELDPRDSMALNGLGNNAWMRGELEQAVARYRAALEAEPANAEARRNLGAALRAGGGR